MNNIIRFDPFREMEEMLKRYRYPSVPTSLSKEHEGILTGSWMPSEVTEETSGETITAFNPKYYSDPDYKGTSRN